MKKEQVVLPKKMAKKERTFKWKRTGKCDPSKCGAFCCRHARMTALLEKDKKRLKSQKKYYELQGFREKGLLNGNPVMAFDFPCAALKGIRCSIYKDRPITCKEFPLHPEHDFYKVCVQNGCTIRFKKVYTEKKKKGGRKK